MQPDLFVHAVRFDGETFSPEQDGPRLHRQLALVKDYMLTRGWHTLAEISQATGCPEASVSARLRDLKKIRFGSFTVEKRRRTKAQWEYKVSR